MNWRLASRLSVITLALLVVAIVAVVGVHAGQSPSSSSTGSSSLQGVDLGNTPAPDFRLTDQNGNQVSLSQFKGEPVVLTFLYTHCPDVCPLTAEKLHSAMQKLGSDAQHVGVLAVSTDPTGDTQAAAISFTNEHKMQYYWHFLIGTESELSPIWASYRVFAAPDISTPGKVNHTSAVFVIDKHGNERAFFSDSLTPDQLVGDLKVLLNE